MYRIYYNEKDATLYEKYPDISIDFIDNPGLMSD